MEKNPHLKDWEEKELAKSIGRFPERKHRFTNHGGDEIPRVALPKGIDDEYLRDLGFPGRYPFTRGVQPTMYRGRLWTMRQYAGFSNAEDSNKRYRYLMDQGTTGLSVAFDLPTQIGYDSDNPMSRGEVGKVGVAIDSLADMEILFNGIPLDKVSTSMTINSPAAVLLAMYVAVGEKQGLEASQLRGTIQNDVLKEYVARGTYIFPPKPSLRLITDIFQWCGRHMPAFNTISISGYHIREAGSTAVQEVAFTLVNACAYVQAALKAGLEIDSFAGRLAFFFNASSDLLEEVAKFRAARRLWARIMKERFGAKKPASQMLRFHTQTAGNTLTAQQIDNNIVRVTLQALAAVLGGTQSLHTNSRDEALALPTEESVRIALRTQQIIAYESGVPDVVDPVGGSYLIENLTDRIEEEVHKYLKKIEDMGGMLTAIEQGFIQKEIQESAYTYQKQLEILQKEVIGINKFVSEGNRPSFEIYNPPKEIEENQIKQLKQIKHMRSEKRLKSSLDSLKQATQSDKNLMPYIYDCVKDMATIGEITSVLKETYGTYKENLIF